MDGNVEHFNARFKSVLSKRDIRVIELYFMDEPGILNFKCSSSEIMINYNTFLKSETLLHVIIQLLGFEIVQSNETIKEI